MHFKFKRERKNVEKKGITYWAIKKVEMSKESEKKEGRKEQMSDKSQAYVFGRIQTIFHPYT